MLASRDVADAVPVVLLTYVRHAHLARTLEGLRAAGVTRLLAYSDGPRADRDRDAVAGVRRLLRAIDWADVQLVEREENLGLGRSVLAAVGETLSRHDAAIVVEDDLVWVPGAYAYLCAALRRYRDDPAVMSVASWTHPLITPAGLGAAPYFDGRPCSWAWGTWARSWGGMDRPAEALLRDCRARGLDVYRYGADLREMAAEELDRNIWYVRWAYHHLARGGLCLRPPWSMVEHIGFDATATNAGGDDRWRNPPLRDAPPIPASWPAVVEHPRCAALWQAASGGRPSLPRRLARGLRRALRRLRGR